MAIKLRDYQLEAHKGLEENLKLGNKTLLVMATGSGKSKTIVSFINKHKGKFVFILVVRGRKLVNQLAQDTKEFDLDYGVYMASHDEFDPRKEIQVCSIDTLSSRGFMPHINSPKPIIMIIDEADQAKAATYQNTINRYLSREGKTGLLGMTATPYNQLDFFDTFINPITPKQLRDRGFLVDYKYFIPKDSLDYKGVEIKRGDWVATQTSKKMNTPSMIIANFKAWLEYGDNRQTLIFCTDKKHAIAFTEYINNFYGKVMAKFVYDKTSEKERVKTFNDFENGTIRFLVNIKIITRGVDFPCIGTILDGAPTINVNLHIQKLGRGSRKNPFYNDCIVIDPCKNCVNNGHFYYEREISLESEYKQNRASIETPLMKVCSNCFRASEPKDFKNRICPFCEFKNAPEKKKKLTKHQKSKLFMQSATEEQIEQKSMINEYKKELWKKMNLGTKYQFDIASRLCHIKLLEKYGEEKILKIKKSIGLKPETLQQFQRRKQYVPLGGMFD